MTDESRDIQVLHFELFEQEMLVIGKTVFFIPPRFSKNY